MCVVDGGDIAVGRIRGQFKRALQRHTHGAIAPLRYNCPWFLPPLGPNDEAIEAARKLLQLDPLDVLANGNLGSVLVYAHRWDEAIAQLRTAIDLDPNFWYHYNYPDRAYVRKRQFKEAIDIFRKGLALEGNTELWSGLGYAYAVAGEREKGRTCPTSCARCR